jgi:hypothetical protein
VEVFVEGVELALDGLDVLELVGVDVVVTVVVVVLGLLEV